MKRKLLYLFFLANGMIITAFWWFISGKLLLNNPSPELIWIIFGRITGLLAVYLVLIQLLLIGRVKWIEKVFGFDRLSTAHHWFGVSAFFLIILHFIFILSGYAMVYGNTWFGQMKEFVTEGDEMMGAIISLILFVAVVIGSITFVKKRMKYETWYFIHLASYLAILFAFGHQLELGYDLSSNNLFAGYWILLYIFTGVNFVIYRFFWQIYLFQKHKFYIDKITNETSDTISIYIKGNLLNEFSFQAGQFGIFRFLDKNNWWQSHPFSFSDIPGKNYLRVTVKNLGDGSYNLKNVKERTEVIIDGPNGVFIEKKPSRSKILLIAGGVGITPIRPLVEQLANNHKDLILLYSVRKSEQIIFRDELKNLSDIYKNFRYYFVVGEESNVHGFNTINSECISHLVPDVADRVVYLCGPKGMMASLKNRLINLNINKSNIHYEKFSF